METMATMSDTIPVVHLLDYGAGNVRSVENAIRKCGYDVNVIKSPDELMEAQIVIFPGVGSFGNAMEKLSRLGFIEPLKQYLQANKRFMGICLGMQTLFEGSEEAPGVRGLGIIPGVIKHFRNTDGFCDGLMSVPHIGWNGVNVLKRSRLFADPLFTCEATTISQGGFYAYFVHSFCAVDSQDMHDWTLCTTQYGNTKFVSAVQKGNVMATQFHPEKSGPIGLAILKSFLQNCDDPKDSFVTIGNVTKLNNLTKRVIACLDVRRNDAGDLVVTKGDGYDVRERTQESAPAGILSEESKGDVRNFGKPVALAQRYYEEGADEITFLNITQFREDTVEANSMHEMLQEVSRSVFVPLTIGGGIRDYGQTSALDVAARYFRSGADKVSLGSYAVEAVIELREHRNNIPDGSSAIEKISKVYGTQAVVISIDPRRVYLKSEDELKSAREMGYSIFTIPSDAPGYPHVDDKIRESTKCWYQCTVAGGRKGRPLDAVQLAKGCELLGAGEILVNCIDMDGKNSGFDIPLVSAVRKSVSIPVIASSGAGKAEHFVSVFKSANVEAALAAGIFHRSEVSIESVKSAISRDGLPSRKIG